MQNYLPNLRKLNINLVLLVYIYKYNITHGYIIFVVNDGDIHQTAAFMQNWLSTFETWLSKYKLSVNKDKSQYLIS